jgi:hypothetical protein
MHYGKMKMTLVVSAVVLFVPFMLQAATPLPDHYHICVDMANGARYDDSGVSGRACNPVAYEQYYHKQDNPGLYQLYITTDLNQPLGNAYVSDAQSGTFYITNSGGRGYDDEIVLLVSINTTTIAPVTSLHIKSSGYQLVTNASQQIVSYTFVPNALDATFTAQDFIYGPQTWKPANTALYPLWVGQNVNDPSTQSLLMFVDLWVGNVMDGMIPGAQYKGAVKVDYAFTGLTHRAVFNAYGWAKYSNQGQGIGWTNQTDGTSGYSGYSVNPPQQWGAAQAEASSASGNRTTASRAANPLFMLLIPMVLVACWKVAFKAIQAIRK